MRAPRPTIAFLKSLPIETFPDPSQQLQIAQGDWLNLELYRVSHPLMDDARSHFLGGGAPDQHRTATQSAKRPVYELRDRGQGAAWRGAVVLDDAGDPWLVYAEKHNRFHDRAAEVLDKAKRATYMPTPAEYVLRDREDAANADRSWRQKLLVELVAAVDRALHAPDGRSTAKLQGFEQKVTTCEVMLELEHDAPPSNVDGLDGAASMVTIVLSFPAKPDQRLQDAAVQEFVPFLQPHPGSLQAVYGKSDALHIFCTISQARLAEIVAAASMDEGAVDWRGTREAPVNRHWVGNAYLTEAFVFGVTVRAVCGTWFVPTRDHTADLPICPECEADRPIAQGVIDAIRLGFSAE